MIVNTVVANKKYANKVLKACLKKNVLLEFLYGHPTIRMNCLHRDTQKLVFAPHLVMDAIYEQYKKDVSIKDKVTQVIIEYFENDRSRLLGNY